MPKSILSHKTNFEKLDGPAGALEWVRLLETHLALPPMDYRAFKGNHDWVRTDRAAAMFDLVNVFDGGMRATVVAAIKRAAKSSWMVDPRYWKDWGSKKPESGYSLLRLMLGGDKRLWLRLTTQTDRMIWQIFLFALEDTAAEHSFNKKELVPLVASKDPNLRTLGLKLMAGTVPDAKKASMRVSGR